MSQMKKDISKKKFTTATVSIRVNIRCWYPIIQVPIHHFPVGRVSEVRQVY